LDLREKRLRYIGLDASKVEPLFPTVTGGYYTAGSWREIRRRRYKELGIEGNNRALRPSFGQRLKDAGASIEAVSRALRHANTMTTERFYARIRTEKAWDSLETLWESPVKESSMMRD
jgi:integrase